MAGGRSRRYHTEWRYIHKVLVVCVRSSHREASVLAEEVKGSDGAEYVNNRKSVRYRLRNSTGTTSVCDHDTNNTEASIAITIIHPLASVLGAPLALDPFAGVDVELEPEEPEEPEGNLERVSANIFHHHRTGTLTTTSATHTQPSPHHSVKTQTSSARSPPRTRTTRRHR